MRLGTSLFLAILFCSFIGFSQKSEAEITAARISKEAHISDTTHGILKPEELEEFKGLSYFDFDSNYQINGQFTKDKGKVFKMPTSTNREPKYRRFGYLKFTLNGKKHTLEVYQNMALKKEKEYWNHLFIPFRDLTSSNESYGGGRYIDATIPKNDSLLIDFNEAYNPYCAYSHRFSCPIPPKENTLNVEVRAGEKTPAGH